MCEIDYGLGSMSYDPARECYLTAQLDGITLICKRTRCKEGAFVWQRKFANGVLPETIVIERAMHLATHGEEL